MEQGVGLIGYGRTRTQGSSEDACALEVEPFSREEHQAGRKLGWGGSPHGIPVHSRVPEEEGLDISQPRPGEAWDSFTGQDRCEQFLLLPPWPTVSFLDISPEKAPNLFLRLTTWMDFFYIQTFLLLWMRTFGSRYKTFYDWNSSAGSLLVFWTQTVPM